MEKFTEQQVKAAHYGPDLTQKIAMQQLADLEVAFRLNKLIKDPQRLHAMILESYEE